MSGDVLRAHADRFLAAATRHRQCPDARIAEVTDAFAMIKLDLDVEMPQHMKVDGISPNGVRRTETATVVLGPSYPCLHPPFTSAPILPEICLISSLTRRARCPARAS